MAHTKHGYHIPDSEYKPDLSRDLANCGGPGFCEDCDKEAWAYKMSLFYDYKEKN